MKYDYKTRVERWHQDKPKWDYVLETFWQHDFSEVLRILNEAGSLDEAVRMADSERDGMIAT